MDALFPDCRYIFISSHFRPKFRKRKLPPAVHWSLRQRLDIFEELTIHHPNSFTLHPHPQGHALFPKSSIWFKPKQKADEILASKADFLLLHPRSRNQGRAFPQRKKRDNQILSFYLQPQKPVKTITGTMEGRSVPIPSHYLLPVAPGTKTSRHCLV